MAITHDFEYFKPATLNEALSLLSKYRENASVLAGGTDLCLKIKEGTETPAAVIDIKGIDELNTLSRDDNGLHIGATVSLNQLIDSDIIKEHYPLFRDAAKAIGSVSTRNRGTMCGNICSAVPSLDSGPVLLLHDALVLTRSTEGERKIPIHEWFVGPQKTARKPEELVIGILVPPLHKKAAGCYVKRGRYFSKDLAQAGVGILVCEDNEYRVAFCAVGPTPKRGTKIEALLNGKELSDALIEEAKTFVPEEISPITDIRASKEYRILVVKVMLERGLKNAVSKLRGKPVEPGAIWV